MAKSDRLLKVTVGVLLLFALIYPTVAKLIVTEPFQTGISVTDPNLRKTGSKLYSDDPKLFCALSQTFDKAITDHKDILMYRSCVGIKDNERNFESKMNTYIRSLSYLVSEETVRSNNFSSVTDHIVNVLARIRAANGTNHKLKGPIYVLMFQAPYYRDERSGVHGNNQVIHAQPFNIHEYGYKSSIILKDIVENQPMWSMEPKQGVQFVFYIMCPMYDTAYKLRLLSDEDAQSSIEACVGYWQKQATNSPMCRLKCADHPGYTCGCINTNTPYKSYCLGPKDNQDRQNREFVNYGSLFRVNENNPRIGAMFDKTAFHKDACVTR